MANQYATPTAAPATQVGSYFVQQYYQMFRQSRDYVHQFYNDSSSMMRIDGDFSESASDMMQIHQLIMSLNFTGIEIQTIKSLDSWSGGVLVVVSGVVKSRKFVGSRKFVQTFFLAPQENGYFVLNDIFHFVDEEPVQQVSVHAQEDTADYHQTVPTQLPDQAASGYPLEEEAVGYLNSVHISGNEPVVDYSYQDHQQQEFEAEPEPEHEPEPEFEAEPEDYGYEEEAHFEDSNVLLQNTVTPSQEPQPSPEEPVGEPEKLTYASILRAKGKAPASPLVTSTFLSQKAAPASDWNDGWNDSQPSLPQSTPSIPHSGFDTTEEASSFEEGESLSVYIRNLPTYLTVADVHEEFSYYGKIKQDGIFLKSRTDTGVCYAFVEYEDVEGVQTAIRASPIMLHGRSVYVEERRQTPGSASRGGGRTGRGGRGRGAGRGRGYGRGNDQNGGYNNNNNRGRSNGFRT